MSHGLPNPPVEPDAVTSLDGLAPKFRSAVTSVLSQMIALDFDAVVSESIRTDARQAWLWGMGREYDDGRGVVTNAPTGDAGWHKFGLAVDIISASKQWDAPLTFWRTLQSLAESSGLVSGATFFTVRNGERFPNPDLPHVQWGAPMRHSPSREAATLYAVGGNPAVWKAVGAL